MPTFPTWKREQLSLVFEFMDWIRGELLQE